VIGVSPRPGEQLTFGPVAAELLESAQCSLLFVSGEAPVLSSIAEAESASEGAAGPGVTTVAA
jgi:hypothetical protein